MKKLLSAAVAASFLFSGLSLTSYAASKSGWVSSKGHWYFYNKSGSVSTGWLKSGNQWYYMDNAGVMKTGWLNYGGKRYFFDSSGAMKTSWIYTGGKWYYFNPSGAMQTGWVYDLNKWYYLDASGAMQTGWLNYGGKLYYLYPSGSMAVNTTINGVTIGADGAVGLINPNTLPYKLLIGQNTIQSVSSLYFYNPTTYKYPYPATAFHSTLGKNIYYYMLNSENQVSVANTATLQHAGDPSNCCALFVSELLRRMGMPIPQGTMRVTQVESRLASLGFIKDTQLGDLKPGDIVFTQGMTHVFTFMGWVNNGQFNYAYVVDNQAYKFHSQVLHVRRLDTNSKDKDTDAAAFFMYKN